MPKTAEERREYKRQWWEANKERMNERKRQWREANKEREDERVRRWRETNPEKAAKKDTITNWKKRGVICDDYDALYEHYLSVANCEDCGVEFTGKIGDGSGKYRCLDHCHETGAFRGVVCTGCNLRRG